MNLYGFAEGDPVNFSDPLGLCPQDMGGDGKTKKVNDCPRGTEGHRQYTSGAVESGWADPLLVLSGGLSGLVSRGFAALGARASATEGATLIGGLSKQGAQAALAEMGLSAAQQAAGRSAVSRATSSSIIDLIKQPADNLMVLIGRQGRDGVQIMQSTISPNGAKSVTQVIIDGAGRVFLDPKKAMP